MSSNSKLINRSANSFSELEILEYEKAGWVLIQGQLMRWGGDYDARLYYDLGNGFGEKDYFPIPTSGKGAINEVIRLPSGIKRLRFVPTHLAGEFELTSLSFVDIGAVERIWRMVRRVMAMIWRHPAQKRKLLGLSLSRMLVDLQGAYDAANKLRAHAAAPNYQDWLAKFGTLDVCSGELDISSCMFAPRFKVLVLIEGAANGAAQKTLQSLDSQLYRSFTCTVLARDAADLPKKDESAAVSDVCCISPEKLPVWMEKFNAMLENDKGQEWIIVLRAGEELARHALLRFASEIVDRPDLAFAYADDDELDASGQRCRPRFKPDWSLAHLRSTNFVGDAVVLRGSVVAEAGGMDWGCFWHGNYDLLLRVVDVLGEGGEKKIAHIPALLLHDARVARPDSETPEWCMHSLRTHLSRNGVAAEVSATLPGCWRVRYRLPELLPRVSIIVPTRDRLELIRRCLESVLEKTSYSNYEILVVNNQSVEPEVLAFLERMGGHEKVRVLHYDLPFNFSAMNNMAVEQAMGEVICLLNNDTEVLSPDWIEEMLGQLLQSKVGVVGAKLYFPDGRVQHAGDLVGVGGVANHAHSFLRREETGYCNRAMVAQEYSAVTAACMLVWRHLYRSLGGLDEQNLAVAFNDVDFCLRVREAGYRVVWTPHAELYHHESVSRGKDLTPEKQKRAKREVAYMRKRWKHMLQNDPYYNPNLSYERADFSLSHAPLVRKPWQE